MYNCDEAIQLFCYFSVLQSEIKHHLSLIWAQGTEALSWGKKAGCYTITVQELYTYHSIKQSSGRNVFKLASPSLFLSLTHTYHLKK